MADVQARLKLLEHISGQALGNDVGVLGCHRDMEDPNLTKGDIIPNKV